jgi:outer membrane protein assembly factor BamB
MTNGVMRVSMMALAGLLVLSQSAAAENWPQWRGPNLNGSSSETNLPDRLDPNANAVWKLELPGPGSSTSIVWEDRILLSALDKQTQKMLAMCVDAKSGKEHWRREIGEGFRSTNRNNLAGPSPITDGKTVWFFYGSGDLAAFDMDGNPLWTRNIQKDHGPFNIIHIYSSSPLLYDGKLYVQVIHRDVAGRSFGGGRGGPGARGGGGGGGGQNQPPPQPAQPQPAPAESYLLIIDPATGKDLHKQPRNSDARAESKEAYSTPIPHEVGGQKQVILVGADCVTGHDASDGREVWRLAGWNPQQQGNWRVVPSVVLVDDKFIFCTPQRESRIIAVTLGGSGDISASKSWENTQVKSDVPVPLVYRGNVYVLDGDARKGVYCLDPSNGQTTWSTPITSRASFRVSPTGADGKIYVMNEQAEVWVLSASDGKVLSHTTLATEGNARGCIVASQSKLFVRTGSTLYCFGPS